MKGFWRIIVPIGIGLIVAGLFLGIGGWGWGSAGVLLPLCLGLGLILAWMIAHLNQLQTLLGLRSTQTNLNALVAIAAVVVILGVINIVAARLPAQLDLSDSQLFSLSPQSRELVSNLDNRVELTAFMEPPDPEIVRRLEQYHQLNPEHITIEILDGRSNPIRANELNVRANNTLVASSGNRRDQIPIPAPLNLERVLTPLLLQLTNPEPQTIYFVRGHEEIRTVPSQTVPSLSQAISQLEAEGYAIADFNPLSSNGVPEDASVVIIAGPRRPWLPAEIDHLMTYLNNGGKVLLMLDPLTEPELDPLLEDWGIQVVEDLIVDNRSEFSQQWGPMVAAVTRYGDHPITSSLAEDSIPTLFPLARSINVVEGIEATPLLLSTDTSWGESAALNSPELTFDEASGDVPGPLVLGVALSRPVLDGPADGTGESNTESETPEPENTTDANLPDGAVAEELATSEENPNETLPEARLVAIGNSGFAIDGNLPQLGNRDLFLNSINWLAERDASLAIRPKAPTNRRILISPGALRWLRFFSAILLPAIAFTIAGLLWWQRR